MGCLRLQYETKLSIIRCKTEVYNPLNPSRLPFKSRVETGYYYYGARYYNPKVSIWLSVDPLWEKYAGRSPYEYVMNNPINAVDPDGKVVIFINGLHGGSGGSRKYWNGLDQRIMNRFKDHHARYYDGALGGVKNTAVLALVSTSTLGMSLMGINLFSSVRKREGKLIGYG